MTKKEWLEDFDYFLGQLETLHPNPYRNYDKDDFYKKLDEVKKQENDLTEENVVRNIAYLTALLNDAHTTLYSGGYGYKIPMDFRVINDKVYIVDAREKDKEALFKEVTFINDIPIKEFTNNLEKYISYETLAFKEFKIGETLDNPALLKRLGLIDKDIYQITYDNNGQTDNIQFEYKEKPIYNDLVKPMIYDQGDHRHYNCKEMTEDKTLYIKYRLCREDKNYSMNEFIEDIDKIIQTGVDKVIIDIRHNQGGDSRVIKPIIERIKVFKEQGKEIIGLIDNGTFSSGIFALVDLKNLGATIMGSETGGTKEARFGNVESITLPNSKVKFICSTKKFNIIKNKHGDLEIVGSGDFETRPVFPMTSFLPDYEVYNEIENLREGKDIVLETALEYGNENKVKVSK